MNRRFFWYGSALILMIGLSLTGCGGVPTEVETEAPPTKVTKNTPAPVQKKATAASPRATTAPERGAEVEIDLPGSAQVPAADILDQVVLLGIGGGEYVCSDPNDLCITGKGNRISLAGFPARREVIILLYQYIKDSNRFVYYTDWVSTIGADGNLVVNMPNLDFFPMVVVLDAQNKTYLRSTFPLDADFEAYYSGSYSPCTDASYQSRLKIGDKVRVAYVNGTDLRLRDSTDHSSLENVIAKIPEGTILYLDDGPKCAGGWIWWPVTYKNQFGWVAEGDGTDWLLEPWK